MIENLHSIRIFHQSNTNKPWKWNDHDFFPCDYWKIIDRIKCKKKSINHYWSLILLTSHKWLYWIDAKSKRKNRLTQKMIQWFNKENIIIFVSCHSFRNCFLSLSLPLYLYHTHANIASLWLVYTSKQTTCCSDKLDRLPYIHTYAIESTQQMEETNGKQQRRNKEKSVKSHPIPLLCDVVFIWIFVLIFTIS